MLDSSAWPKETKKAQFKHVIQCSAAKYERRIPHASKRNIPLISCLMLLQRKWGIFQRKFAGTLSQLKKISADRIKMPQKENISDFLLSSSTTAWELYRYSIVLKTFLAFLQNLTEKVTSQSRNNKQKLIKIPPRHHLTITRQ